MARRGFRVRAAGHDRGPTGEEVPSVRSADEPGATGAPAARDRVGDEGGDPACWAALVCPACGRVTEQRPPGRRLGSPLGPATCEHCGAALPDD
jgi:hypothetical protein